MFKRFILVTLACTFLSAATINSASISVPVATPVTSPALIQYALDKACKYTAMDCTDVPVPEVEYWTLLDVWGFVGLFEFGNPVIYLDVKFIGQLTNPADADLYGLAILIHETVHYLDWYLNDAKGTPESICASEGMAWSATNLWLEFIGSEDTFWDWRNWYDNC